MERRLAIRGCRWSLLGLSDNSARWQTRSGRSRAVIPLKPQNGLNGAPRHSFAVRAHPGLTSWDILSRPCGTRLGEFVYPGLTSWATLSRPYGTDRDLPGELICFQPVGYKSGASKKLIWTGLTLSRPFGTVFLIGVHADSKAHEARSPALFSPGSKSA
jgi:hypothetical protein